jgi:hypothetical protein
MKQLTLNLILLVLAVHAQTLSCIKEIETQKRALKTACGATAETFDGITVVDLLTFSTQIEVISRSLDRACSAECDSASLQAREVILAQQGCEFQVPLFGFKVELALNLYDAARSAVCSRSNSGDFCLPVQIQEYRNSFKGLTSLKEGYEALFKNKALLCTDCARVQVDTLKAATIPAIPKEIVLNIDAAMERVCQGSYTTLGSVNQGEIASVSIIAVFASLALITI